MKYYLVFPMAVYVFYMWILAVLNFRTRLNAIKTGQVEAKVFKNFLGSPLPERVQIVGRHYDNQFQLPLVFLIGCSAHMLVDHVGWSTICLAWLFVATRLVHSWVHLGSNKLQWRVLAFAAGWVTNMILWLQMVYFATKAI